MTLSLAALVVGISLAQAQVQPARSKKATVTKTSKEEAARLRAEFEARREASFAKELELQGLSKEEIAKAIEARKKQRPAACADQEEALQKMEQREDSL